MSEGEVEAFVPGLDAAGRGDFGRKAAARVGPVKMFAVPRKKQRRLLAFRRA